jgi:very-short-patch-repair endonuclease
MRASAMRGGNEPKVARARELRKIENDAEEKLWHERRGRRLNGHKFIRQLPIGPYFADFACREANLVVEVDGSQHAGGSRDRYRDEMMNANGWSVLRIWHADVLSGRKSVLETIVAAVDGRLNKKMIGIDAKFLPSILETR